MLFFAGLSFIGYIARRAVGPAHGYPLTGALAGIVSSTNATFTFARLSRMRQHSSATLATGAVAACTVLFPRVLIATSVLDARVALMRGWFGDGGLLATGALLGLTDVDALTISMARSVATGISPQTAARAIASGIVANSVMKATIAVGLGTAAFAARTGGVLAVMAMVLVASLVLPHQRFHVPRQGCCGS